jgi:amidophosphoribosyltransferase
MGLVRHNCGFCVSHTLHDAYSFIKALQHRGREATGIAFIGDEGIDVLKWSGSVEKLDIEDLYKIFPSKKYHTYLAHVRYATRGRKDKILQDAHPHVIGGKIKDNGSHVIITDCDAVIVHNGQVNQEFLELIKKENLKTNCDSEALLHFFKQFGEKKVLEEIPGAYSLAVAIKGTEGVIVLRDRAGIKPGVLGWKDGKYLVASEDVAFRKNGGKFIEDLEPGYAYYLHSGGDYSRDKLIESKKKHCFFEYNYIANLDSVIDGVSVRRVREILGEALAKEIQPEADFVTFLPRCPEFAARRYAEIVKKPFKQVFYKTRGERSFLGSTTKDREDSIKTNLYIMPLIEGEDSEKVLKDKTVILVDDSTIRGNNSKRAVKTLLEKGVKKVYLLNYTPQIGVIPGDGVERGCIYGVDMPPNDDFIVRGRTAEEINENIGAEVFFLSIEGMLNAFEKVGMKRENLCHFCIGGKKPF